MPLLSINNFTSGELSPLLQGRVDLNIYYRSADKILNYVPLPYGPLNRRAGFRFIAESYSNTLPTARGGVRLIPYKYSAKESYLIEFGDRYTRVLTRDGYLKDSADKIISIPSSYKVEDIKDITFAQNKDILYLCHPNYSPRYIYVKNGTFYMQPYYFGADCSYAESPRAKVVSTGTIDPKTIVRTVQYFIVAVDSNGTPAFPITYTNAVSIPAKLDMNVYVELTWTAGVTVAEYHIYQVSNGIEGYIGKTAGLTYYDYGVIAPNYAKGLPKRVASFSYTNDYPSKVTFFDQRLILAGTKNEPNTIWGSSPGLFRAFVAESTPTDFCSWKFSIASSEANELSWLISSNKLLIGTTGEEWRMSGANGSTITPTSVEVRKETSWGSSNLRPLNVGGDILFVDRTGKAIRQFCYSSDSDGYLATNINAFAEHLTREQKIIDWEYLRGDYNVIYIVTDKGNLLGVTYDRDNQVCAWHRYETDGKFLSVSSLSSEGGDELIAVIERNVNGKAVKYIERLERNFNCGNDADLSNAYFLDSMLSYSGLETDSIYGLTHLKGKTVTVISDGIEEQAVVDSNGAIKLKRKVTSAHVGLPYTSELVTLPLEAQLQDGTMQTRTKRITDIGIKLENSFGLDVGTDYKNIAPLSLTDINEDEGRKPKLFTGVKRISNMAGYDINGSIIIRQKNALPATIIGIYPQVKSISE